LERFAKHMIKFDKTLLPDDYSKAWFLRWFYISYFGI
jgi:hypothetical protein